MTVHLILSDKEFGLWHVAQISGRYVHAPVAQVSVASRGPQFLYQYSLWMHTLKIYHPLFRTRISTFTFVGALSKYDSIDVKIAAPQYWDEQIARVLRSALWDCGWPAADWSDPYLWLSHNRYPAYPHCSTQLYAAIPPHNQAFSVHRVWRF